MVEMTAHERGALVAARRKALGLSQAQLGKTIGVLAQSIQQLEAGQVASPRYLVKLARVLDLPEILPGDGDDGLAALVPPAARRQLLPVYGVAVGGDDASFELNGQVHEYVARPPSLDAARDAYALRVVGSSMEPRYFANEMLYINPNHVPRPTDFVVVELRDGKAMVKRLVRQDDRRVVLEQYNPPDVFEVPRTQVIRLHKIVQAGEA